MGTIQVAAERPIGAPAERVYRYIADFNEHHFRFLPPAFSDLRVERGGYGAGTVITFKVTVAGRTQAYCTEVEEPEPGRVLVESDPRVGTVTTFTVAPEGDGSRVKIETTWRVGGIGAPVQRLLAPPIMRRLYRDELERLDRYARALEPAAGA